MMRVRISDPMLLGDLVGLLARCECSPEVLGRAAVGVAPRAAAAGPALERLELAGYLWVWAHRHPGVKVLVDGPAARLGAIPRPHEVLALSETRVARTR